MKKQVTVIGAGLAGSECSLQLAARGIEVLLIEQRPTKQSPAHHTSNFAELVCSNSLKSTKEESAAGILKRELAGMKSFLLQFAQDTAVPAGGALAVDREKFSSMVTAAISSNPLIKVERREAVEIPAEPCVIAAGPLCSDSLYDAISQRLGTHRMSFYDAAAPIIAADSIDRSIVFAQSRYSEGEKGDYLNCPLNKDEYGTFIQELLAARRVVSHEFEQRDLFQACQPIEEVARTGVDSLRFGALKPVGLTDPRDGRRPWAAVQLRAENVDATAYNLVGFQTNLVWGEQRRVFSMIPGLGEAEFLRYGVMHRNSFVDAPHALTPSFAIPYTHIRLAGQLTGTEGYVEAIASGLLAALNTYADLIAAPEICLPKTGALGSLVAYATDPNTKEYQPMHVNFGLFPPLDEEIKKKDERRRRMTQRAQRDFDAYLSTRHDIFVQEGDALATSL